MHLHSTSFFCKHNCVLYKTGCHNIFYFHFTIYFFIITFNFTGIENDWEVVNEKVFTQSYTVDELKNLISQAFMDIDAPGSRNVLMLMEMDISNTTETKHDVISTVYLFLVHPVLPLYTNLISDLSIYRIFFIQNCHYNLVSLINRHHNIDMHGLLFPPRYQNYTHPDVDASRCLDYKFMYNLKFNWLELTYLHVKCNKFMNILISAHL